MSKKGFWRPLETMGFKFGSLWVPCRYLGGAPDQTFFSKVFRFFFVRKMGPLPKNSGPNPRSFFVLEGGYPGTPSDLRPPPPWANPSYVPA